MSYQVALNFEDAVTQIIGCRPDETAAEASHKARINVPPDCRDGSCGTCKSMCKSGRYDGGDHIYEALTEGEAALGYCLPCRTTPQGDLILRIPVITGSARGIGLVVARRLVAESAEVTLVDRSHLVGRCRPRWNATVGLTSWRTRSPHRPPSNTPRPVSVRRQRAGQNRRPAPADALPPATSEREKTWFQTHIVNTVSSSLMKRADTFDETSRPPRSVSSPPEKPPRTPSRSCPSPVENSTEHRLVPSTTRYRIPPARLPLSTGPAEADPYAHTTGAPR